MPDIDRLQAGMIALKAVQRWPESVETDALPWKAASTVVAYGMGKATNDDLRDHLVALDGRIQDMEDEDYWDADQTLSILRCVRKAVHPTISFSLDIVRDACAEVRSP